MRTTCPVVREKHWRIPSLTVVQRLYEALRREVRRPGAWEDDALVLTVYLAYTGARISEALKATADDLFPDISAVRIKGTKEGSFRVVPVPPEVMYLLQTYVVRRGRADVLFPISRRGATEAVLRKTRKLIGCSMSPHLLRHAFAIKLLTVDGWAPGDIREALGHRRLKTTEIYVAYVGQLDLAKKRVSL